MTGVSGPAVSPQKAEGVWGGGRLGGRSPFIPCRIGPSSLLPPHPQDLSQEQGTRKLLQPHLFPFLPSAPGAPCLPGRRGGAGLLSEQPVKPTPRDLLGNKATSLAQRQFSNALLPKLDDPQRPPDPSGPPGPREGQDKPELTQAKQPS